MVRKLDYVGRITIPKEARNKLRWEDGDSIKLEIQDNGIFLKKQQKTCALCGINQVSFSLGENGICKNCYEALKEMEETIDS